MLLASFFLHGPWSRLTLKEHGVPDMSLLSQLLRCSESDRRGGFPVVGICLCTHTVHVIGGDCTLLLKEDVVEVVET